LLSLSLVFGNARSAGLVGCAATFEPVIGLQRGNAHLDNRAQPTVKKIRVLRCEIRETQLAAFSPSLKADERSRLKWTHRAASSAATLVHRKAFVIKPAFKLGIYHSI
jgi:hypothetical protein